MPLSWPDADHIYLSPHLDDVVLSCGGTIHEQARRGERVAVVTIFAASPQSNRPLSGFAQSLHDRWQASIGWPPEAASTPPSADFPDPAAVRRREDARALAALGEVQPVHYELADCIYRLAAGTGEALYASEEAIFGEVHPTDPALIALNDSPRPPVDSVLYAPLAIGHHVDHQIIYDVIRGWNLPAGQVWYYEDYPYAAQQDEPVRALLTRRGDWQARVIPLSERALAAKIDAAAAYESQISTFWQSADAMASALRQYAEQVGGERLWRPAS